MIVFLNLQKVKEENLKFVLQCCDIDCECCSSENIECPNNDDIEESDLSYSPRLMIPKGESQFGGKYEERSAKCAICFEEYSQGEMVVGSNNQQCPHVYHVDCILTWLSKSTGDKVNYCCPVCRQLFIVDEEV